MVSLRIGYVLLVTDLLGFHDVRDRADFNEALTDYRSAFPNASYRPGGRPLLRSVHGFRNWYIRRELDSYEPPALLVDKIKMDMAEKLNEKQRQVIELRYGLVDGVERTLEEIAPQLYNDLEKRMGVSWQRVHQLESRALVKLRFPYSDIRSYLGEQLNALLFPEIGET